MPQHLHCRSVSAVRTTVCTVQLQQVRVGGILSVAFLTVYTEDGDAAKCRLEWYI